MRLPTFLLIGACAAASGMSPAVAQTAPDAAFTLVVTGDLILSRPVSALAEPGALPQAKGFADVLTLLEQADVTYGNMETSIFDYRRFDGAPYSWDGDWMLTAEPAVAADLRAMGFDIVSRANNHALDWGVEGMRETIAQLGAAGLVSSGTGESAQAATTPAFFESGGKRIGLVSMASTFRPTTDALDPGPAAPHGRPGVNALTVKRTALVDAPTLKTLHEVECSFAPPGECTAAVELFGTPVREPGAGEAPFTYVHEMDADDLARNLAAVREAKAGADYVLATIHAHEGLADEAPPKTWEAPAAFLEPLAKALIDAGADGFVATGIHHLAGIEIYRGKPIFYGLGNFFWSDIQEPLSAELYGSLFNSGLLADSFEHPGRATDSDISNVLNANSTFATAGDPALNRTFHTVLARAAYDEASGAVISIRLYPIDLGYGDKLTRSGVPRRAGRAIADLVLDRIIAMSPKVRIVKAVEDGYSIGVLTPIAGS